MNTLNEVKQKVCEKTGMKEEDVQELIDGIVKETKETFSTLGKEELESRCVKATTAFFRRFMSQPSDLIEAVILLDGGVQVRNRSRIGQIEKKAKEDIMAKEQMLRSGEIIEVGGKFIPCDMKPTFPSGDPNPNFKKPLVESKFRILDGRFVDKDKTIKNFQLSLNENDVNKTFPSRTPIKMYTTRGQNVMDDGTIRLYLKTGTKPMAGEKVWDVDKEVQEMFNDRILPIKKFDEAISVLQTAGNTEVNRFMVKGEVVELNLERAKPFIRLQDEGGIDETPLTLFVKIPNNLLQDANTVAPWSLATVIGQIWKMPGRDGGEALRGITAMAIWSDEKAVVAKEIGEKNIIPQEGDDLKEEDFG